MDKLQVTWNNFIHAATKLVSQIQPVSPEYDVIMGLTRGGLITAVQLSHALSIPLFTFDPHNLNTEGKPRNYLELPISPAIVRRVLVVDDISDTGKTLNKVVKFLSNRGFYCDTATVYFNEARTVHIPKYVVHKSGNKWVVFPYECE